MRGGYRPSSGSRKDIALLCRPTAHCNAVHKRHSGVIMAQTGPFAVLSSLFLLAVEYAPCASLNR
jgi:hypothetical protein